MQKLTIKNFYNLSFCLDYNSQNFGPFYSYIDQMGNKVAKNEHLGYLFHFIELEMDGEISFHCNGFPVINTKEFV